MNMWWSWALAAVGLVGMWLAGTGKRLGWTIGVAAQLLWIAYAIATRQYGFLVTAVAYAFVYLRNLHRASKSASKTARQKSASSPAQTTAAPRPSRPRVRVRFAWYDLWIGAYWDRWERVLYVCPFPTLLFEIRL